MKHFRQAKQDMRILVVEDEPTAGEYLRNTAVC